MAGKYSFQKGKQVNGNGGESPSIGNMEIPSDSSSVNMISNDTQGEKDIVNQKTDATEEELNDLYYRIYDVENERATLYAEMKNAQKEIENIEKIIDTGGTDRIDLYQKRMDKFRQLFSESKEAYDKVDQEYKDMNKRIFQLETGSPDYEPRVDWRKGILEEEDHGL